MMAIQPAQPAQSAAQPPASGLRQQQNIADAESCTATRLLLSCGPELLDFDPSGHVVSELWRFWATHEWDGKRDQPLASEFLEELERQSSLHHSKELGRERVDESRLFGFVCGSESLYLCWDMLFGLWATGQDTEDDEEPILLPAPVAVD